MHDQRPRRKLVLPGGSGHLGRLLARHFVARGDDVVVLGRGAGRAVADGARFVRWDGRDIDPAWADEVDGADAVINLAGRSVDCRYDKTNLEEMLSSRIDSTAAVGRAIERATAPPPVWLQMSTATIYAHDPPVPHDEVRGVIGGREPDAPRYWRFSVHIAEAWERTLADARTPDTRRVAMRTSIVMGRERGGAFGILRRLARLGLGGPIAGGRMQMSWIHERDFVRAVELLLEDESLEGAVNLAAPTPLPQREFMAALRAALRVPIGLPQPAWLVRMGAAMLSTDAELVLKSRSVVSTRLAEAGFTFEFPTWPEAATDLVRG